MAKFVIDFPMTIYATEVIEAESKEDAQKIAEKLLDSWEFFCERLYPDYRDWDTHENWDNCGRPEVTETPAWTVTMDEDLINDFIG